MNFGREWAFVFFFVSGTKKYQEQPGDCQEVAIGQGMGLARRPGSLAAQGASVKRIWEKGPGIQLGACGGFTVAVRETAGRLP